MYPGNFLGFCQEFSGRSLGNPCKDFPKTFRYILGKRPANFRRSLGMDSRELPKMLECSPRISQSLSGEFSAKVRENSEDFLANRREKLMATPDLSREEAREISGNFLAGILGNGPGRCSGAARRFSKDFWGNSRQMPGNLFGKSPGNAPGNAPEQSLAWIPGKCPGKCLGVYPKDLSREMRGCTPRIPQRFFGIPDKSPENLHEFPGVAQGNSWVYPRESPMIFRGVPSKSP